MYHVNLYDNAHARVLPVVVKAEQVITVFPDLELNFQAGTHRTKTSTARKIKSPNVAIKVVVKL